MDAALEAVEGMTMSEFPLLGRGLGESKERIPYWETRPAILTYSRLSAVIGSTWAARMAGAAAANNVTIIVNKAAAP